MLSGATSDVQDCTYLLYRTPAYTVYTVQYTIHSILHTTTDQSLELLLTALARYA